MTHRGDRELQDPGPRPGGDAAGVVATLIVAAFTLYAFRWAGAHADAVLVGLALAGALGLVLSRPRWPGPETAALGLLFVTLAGMSVLFPPSEHADPRWLGLALLRLALATVVVLCFLAAAPDHPSLRRGIPVITGALAVMVLIRGLDLGPWPIHPWTVKFHGVWLVLLTWTAIAGLWRRSTAATAVAVGIVGLTAAATFTGTYESAKIALVVGALVFAAAHLRSPIWHRLGATAVVLHVLLLPLLWPLRRLPDVAFQSNWIERVIAYDVSSALIRASWWLGLGFGASRRVTVAALPAYDGHLPGGHPHNLALLFWLELGVLGAVLLVAALAAIARFLARSTASGRGGPATWAAVATWLVVTALSFDMWEARTVLLHACFLAALAVAARSDLGDRDPPPESRPAVTRGLLALAVVAVVAYPVHHLARDTTDPSPEGPAEVRVAEPLASLEIAGPCTGLAPSVDSRSVFEAMPPVGSGSPLDAVEAAFDLLGHRLEVRDTPVGTTLEAALFGFGAGSSRDLAAMLVALCHQHGVQARILTVDGHGLSEVWFRRRWRLYDPSHRLDLSARRGWAVSLDAVRRNPGLVPDGLDPVGYDASELRQLYGGAEVAEVPLRQVLRAPTFSLQEGQVLTVRRRPSITPSTSTGAIGDRDHLTPGYEVVLRSPFTTAEVSLVTGLPLVGLEIHGEADLIAVVDGRRALRPRDPEGLEEALRGTTRPVTLVAAHRRPREVVATYHLAAWCGDRLLEPSGGASLRFPTTRGVPQVNTTPLSAEPRVDLGGLRTFANGDGTFTVEVEVLWHELRGDAPVTHELILDELASSLPHRPWQEVRRWPWTWHPTMGTTGSEVERCRWRPADPPSPHRPPNQRTLLVHGRGPAMTAGTSLTAQVILDEEPDR